MSYYDDDDLDDLRAEVAAEKRYFRKFMSAPDCRDPAHPGCPSCAEHDGEGEEANED